MLALKVLLGGASNGRKEFSKGIVAPGAALGVRRRVKDAMEGCLVVAVLPERMVEYDVDHSEFFFTQADDITHSDFFFARVNGIIHSDSFFTRVLPVSGSETHVLAEHLLVYVRR